MKTKNLRRKPASIAKRRWAAYAAAGAATALVGSNSAEAAVHYSGRLDVCFGPHKDKLKRFPLDQPGDYFWFEHNTFADTATFSVHGVGGFFGGGYFRGFFSVSRCNAFVSRLSVGQYISPGPFANGGLTCSFGFPYGILSRSSFRFYRSQWTDPGIGYVGFLFYSGAGVQYGWARVRMSNRPENAFAVIDYAYADPGEPIRAGQKFSNEVVPEENDDMVPEENDDMVPEENDDMVPEEGSLGALALGAAGLLAWRKRRSRAAR